MPPLIEEGAGRTEESTRANSVRPYRVVSPIAKRNPYAKQKLQNHP